MKDRLYWVVIGAVVIVTTALIAWALSIMYR